MSFFESASRTETKPVGGLGEPPALATRFPSAVAATASTREVTPVTGTGAPENRTPGPGGAGTLGGCAVFGGTASWAFSSTNPAATTTPNHSTACLMASPRRPIAEHTVPQEDADRGRSYHTTR
jgi:hypothetical protein